MFRRKLIDLLMNRPMSVRDIARLEQVGPREIADDIQHLLKSLRHTEFTAHVTPACCRKCGFEFGPDKLTKPSKCPECHSTWTTEPRIMVRSRSGDPTRDQSDAQ